MLVTTTTLYDVIGGIPGNYACYYKLFNEDYWPHTSCVITDKTYFANMIIVKSLQMFIWYFIWLS